MVERDGAYLDVSGEDALPEAIMIVQKGGDPVVIDPTGVFGVSGSGGITQIDNDTASVPRTD